MEFEWIEPITDRTIEDVALISSNRENITTQDGSQQENLKGSLDFRALDRIANNILYLKQETEKEHDVESAINNLYGNSFNFDMIIYDWKKEYFTTQEKLNYFLYGINVISVILTGEKTELPPTEEWNYFETINQIESEILSLYEKLNEEDNYEEDE